MVGGLSVVAAPVAGSPGPALLTARTDTFSAVLSPNPPNSALVPVPSVCLVPLTVISYAVMGAPLSSGVRQVAVTVPRLVAVALTESPPGAFGLVNGTTDAL